LHIACANGYNTVLEFLLNDCHKAIENGAPIVPVDLASRDDDGWTPLHVATFWGHVSILFEISTQLTICDLYLFFKQKAIEILLENGADVNLKTNNNETVIELCDDSDVREFILQKIETLEQQKQAAARAAAAALQAQMRTNSSISNNGSIKSNDKSSNNNNNNSGRSLKRTSTGVTRR
jgi:ankyrin repeat protein